MNVSYSSVALPHLTPISEYVKKKILRNVRKGAIAAGPAGCGLPSQTAFERRRSVKKY